MKTLALLVAVSAAALSLCAGSVPPEPRLARSLSPERAAAARRSSAATNAPANKIFGGSRAICPDASGRTNTAARLRGVIKKGTRP